MLGAQRAQPRFLAGLVDLAFFADLMLAVWTYGTFVEDEPELLSTPRARRVTVLAILDHSFQLQLFDFCFEFSAKEEARNWTQVRCDLRQRACTPSERNNIIDPELRHSRRSNGSM